jgi:hypothetical protein
LKKLQDCGRNVAVVKCVNGVGEKPPRRREIWVSSQSPPRFHSAPQFGGVRPHVMTPCFSYFRRHKFPPMLEAPLRESIAVALIWVKDDSGRDPLLKIIG